MRCIDKNKKRSSFDGKSFSQEITAKLFILRLGLESLLVRLNWQLSQVMRKILLDEFYYENLEILLFSALSASISGYVEPQEILWLVSIHLRI